MNKFTNLFFWLLLVMLISCTSDLGYNLPSSTPVIPEQTNTASLPIATQEVIVANLATPTLGSTPLKSFLSVLSEPEGATITIAEVGISDKTPYSTELPPGSYTVSLSLEGYQDWKENVSVAAGVTSEILAYLLPNHRVVGPYIALAEVGGLGAVDELPYLAHIAWKPEQLVFVYAIGKGVSLTEAKDWSWWQYDPLSDENLQIDAPESLVSDETRAELDLCPLNEEEWVGPAKCSYLSALIESDISDLIAFSPLLLEDFPYSEGELWIAGADGLNAQKLADFAPSYVHWSSDGQWLVTGRHFPGLAGQETHFLATIDGSFMESLQQITRVDSFNLNGLFPEFNPNKQELLYAGSSVAESLEESDYKLYILNLINFESRLVTDRLGLFQWADDGKGIYVLDGALDPIKPSEPPQMRETSLYYIDITQDPPQEYLIASEIPYYPQSNYGTWYWAYSPTLYAIAYVGFQDKPELGVLFLEPFEESE